jgi:hypothetical protein
MGANTPDQLLPFHPVVAKVTGEPKKKKKNNKQALQLCDENPASS